jgi:guanylate kinase
MENKKYTILALFGESGAGKDTIKKVIVNNMDNINGIVSYTTRPSREKEVDGVDYHFVSNAEFANMVLDGSMLEATSFNEWFYGTAISALQKDKINIGVFNPQAIECLLQDSRLNVIPIYVYCSDKNRLLRSLKREKNPDCSEICRRFLADKKDFSDADFDYIVYSNNNKNTNEKKMVSQMKGILKELVIAN